MQQQIHALDQDYLESTQVCQPSLFEECVGSAEGQFNNNKQQFIKKVNPEQVPQIEDQAQQLSVIENDNSIVGPLLSIDIQNNNVTPSTISANNQINVLRHQNKNNTIPNVLNEDQEHQFQGEQSRNLGKQGQQLSNYDILRERSQDQKMPMVIHKKNSPLYRFQYLQFSNRGKPQDMEQYQKLLKVKHEQEQHHIIKKNQHSQSQKRLLELRKIKRLVNSGSSSPLAIRSKDQSTGLSRTSLNNQNSLSNLHNHTYDNHVVKSNLEATNTKHKSLATNDYLQIGSPKSSLYKNSVNIQQNYPRFPSDPVSVLSFQQQSGPNDQKINVNKQRQVSVIDSLQTPLGMIMQTPIVGKMVGDTKSDNAIQGDDYTLFTPDPATNPIQKIKIRKNIRNNNNSVITPSNFQKASNIKKLNTNNQSSALQSIYQFTENNHQSSNGKHIHDHFSGQNTGSVSVQKPHNVGNTPKGIKLNQLYMNQSKLRRTLDKEIDCISKNNNILPTAPESIHHFSGNNSASFNNQSINQRIMQNISNTQPQNSNHFHRRLKSIDE